MEWEDEGMIFFSRGNDDTTDEYCMELAFGIETNPWTSLFVFNG
jgi:hypothetical protein